MRKTLLTAILSIAMCMCLLTGATFNVTDLDGAKYNVTETYGWIKA